MAHTLHLLVHFGCRALVETQEIRPDIVVILVRMKGVHLIQELPETLVKTVFVPCLCIGIFDPDLPCFLWVAPDIGKRMVRRGCIVLEVFQGTGNFAVFELRQYFEKTNGIWGL